jgi:glycosyltransferase involved in cell wall biosynthesis
MSKILVIPHYKNNGGSGKYIANVIDDLVKNNKTVFLAGSFASQYVKGEVIDLDLSILNQLVLPFYKGVSKLKILYFFIRLFIRLIAFSLNREALKGLTGFDFVILTSSIQIPILLLSKYLAKDLKFVLLIQEDFNFNFVGRALIRFAKSDNVKYVVITAELKSKLRSSDIKSYLLPNKFEIQNAFETIDKRFDLLYVGGAQKIKGFNFIKNNFGRFGYKLLAVGFDSIEHLNAGGTEFKAYVDNINDCYLMSRVLIIPITHYHFSRPAIEAGLLGLPFLMTDLGVDVCDSEYIKPGKNCLLFSAGDVDDFILKVKQILDDYYRFSENSRFIALRYVEKYNHRNIVDSLAGVNHD